MTVIAENALPVGSGHEALGRRGSLDWPLKQWTFHSVRGTLVWLVVICVLPGWLGMGLLITTIYQSERERVIQNTVMTAGAMAQAVDAELSSTRTALEVLATAPEINAADFVAFYMRAKELLRSGTVPGSNIVLTDSSGQQNSKHFGAVWVASATSREFRRRT